MDKKNFFLRRIALLLAVIMVVAMIGCTKGPTNQGNVENTENEGQQESEIIVTDHLGREVRFEKPAETIVSGYYISSSMLIALGLEDRLVGIEAKPDTRPIYKLAAPSFLELPTVGTMKEFDLEGTAALKPDLVILSIRLKDSIESLEKLGFKVIAINPESMGELEEALDMIGKATGTEERVNKLKSYYKDKTEELSKLIGGREKKRVYLAGNSDFLTTATSKMYQDSLITNSGGINVAANIEDTYWATISYEQLIDYDPDVIIGAAGASYTIEDIRGDKSLESLRAIKDGEVYIMPSTIELWDSPIASGIIGNMWLTSVLHDEVYPFDKFQDDVYDFYGEFYQIDIDRDELVK